jgi:hypothetical protein
MEMETQPEETSPMKAVSEALDGLQSDFRNALEVYATRIDGEIDAIRRAIEANQKTPASAAKLRDLRDMLTLLRKFQIKPEKGRRKDLKKIDTLIGDLTLLIENW